MPPNTTKIVHTYLYILPEMGGRTGQQNTSQQPRTFIEALTSLGMTANTLGDAAAWPVDKKTIATLRKIKKESFSKWYLDSGDGLGVTLNLQGPSLAATTVGILVCQRSSSQHVRVNENGNNLYQTGGV